MEQVGLTTQYELFGHWALVMGVAFFSGVCIAAFLGWLLVEREGAPFNRNEVDNGRRDDD